MHVGSLRTALFAWAFARQAGGQFILRIEDTDKKREEAGSIQHIKDSLEWLGITWDEDYLQSERLELYKQHAQQLIDRGLAYEDIYSQEQVEDFRNQAKSAKRAFLFRDHRPPESAVPADWYGSLPLRFKVPQLKRYEWQDEVRGQLSAGEEALDDFVLIKADGYPTYNFAHVIDDYLMNISHVMRGEEFIASTPKFLSLMDAFGWEWPTFATLPPVLGLQGGKKLSKRDGAKDVLDYREEGYLPDAVANFLASLGWNDGTDQEVFTLAEIVAKISLSKIQKSGARFDEAKLEWLNWKHLQRLLESDTTAALGHLNIQPSGEADYMKNAALLAAGKSSNSGEFIQQMQIFTSEPTLALPEIAQAVDAGLQPEQAKHYLEEAAGTLAELDNWDTASLEPALRGTMQRLSAEGRIFLNLVRWAASGQKVSPSLFEMLEVLGKDKTILRLKTVAGSL
jgi:glutamyl-tRNA synthetase